MKNTETFPERNAACLEYVTETLNADYDLRKKVCQTLQSDCQINSEKITVRVSGRIVYLEGIVGSERERNMAYEAVMNIFGIRNVVNYLTFPCPYLIRNIA